jgi:peptidylprolyl isomerase
MKKIENGDTVSVHYKGTLEDGTVFDTSLVEGREPIKVTLGQGQLIKGFENGLIGMSVGEKKTITLDPADAYGDVIPEAIIDIPLENLPPNVEAGQILQGNGPQGPFVVTVVEIKENVARLDHNHPMAGKKLIFDLDVVEVH